MKTISGSNSKCTALFMTLVGGVLVSACGGDSTIFFNTGGSDPCSNADYIAQMGTTDAWLEPDYLDCTAKSQGCERHQASSYWLRAGESVDARWNSLQWTLGKCEDDGPGFIDPCELCTSQGASLECPIPDSSNTGTIAGANAAAGSAPQLVIATFVGSLMADPMPGATAFGWFSGCTQNNNPTASITPVAPTSVLLLTREGEDPNPSLIAGQVRTLPINQLMTKTADQVEIAGLIAPGNDGAMIFTKVMENSLNCEDGYLCWRFAASEGVTDSVWPENFSPNLRVTDVVLLRGNDNLEPNPIPECLHARQNRFFEPLCNPLANPGTSFRCYADKTAENGGINMQSCRTNADGSQVVDTEVTLTYQLSTPLVPLEWVASFNVDDLDFDNDGAPDIQNDEALRIQFTVVGTN